MSTLATCGESYSATGKLYRFAFSMLSWVGYLVNRLLYVQTYLSEGWPQMMDNMTTHLLVVLRLKQVSLKVDNYVSEKCRYPLSDLVLIHVTGGGECAENNALHTIPFENMYILKHDS